MVIITRFSFRPWNQDLFLVMRVLYLLQDIFACLRCLLKQKLRSVRFLRFRLDLLNGAMKMSGLIFNTKIQIC